MNVSKGDQQKRRELVKEYYLKGNTAYQISKILKNKGLTACPKTVEKDINYLQAIYSKLITNNPHLAKLQVEKVMKMVDEVDIVKKEFWDIYHDLKEENTPKHKGILDTLNRALTKISNADIDAAQELISDAINDLQKVKKPYYTSRLDTLKAILSRTDYEVKLLNLCNPTKMIQGEYISVETLKIMLQAVKSIIEDFIPKDKRQYAIERMKKANPATKTGAEIIDAEVIE